MTNLIPLDAAIGALEERRDQYRQDSQTWLQIQMDVQTIRAIPTIDPAVIRDAALALSQECPWRDDTSSYREWHEDHRAIATRLLALIGEKK